MNDDDKVTVDNITIFTVIIAVVIFIFFIVFFVITIINRPEYIDNVFDITNEIFVVKRANMYK